MCTQSRDYDTDQINSWILHVTISSLCFYTYDLYCFAHNDDFLGQHPLLKCMHTNRSVHLSFYGNMNMS